MEILDHAAAVLSAETHPAAGPREVHHADQVQQGGRSAVLCRQRHGQSVKGCCQLVRLRLTDWSDEMMDDLLFVSGRQWLVLC